MSAVHREADEELARADGMQWAMQIVGLLLEFGETERQYIVDRLRKSLHRIRRPIARDGFRVKQERFCNEFLLDFNASRAALRAGYRRGVAGHHLLKKPRVLRELRKRMEVLADKTKLDAEYVRNYLLGVLEFCPTDYFMVAPDGDMVLDPAALNTMPRYVRMLIDRIEVRYIGGKKYYRVEFVSKSAALTIAARYTLTQKFEANVNTVPWDAIMAPESEDAVEAKLREYAARNAETAVVPVAPSTNGSTNGHVGH